MTDYDKIENGSQEQLCIICLEGNSDTKKLIDGQWLLITDDCNCDYNVHKQCVDRWLLSNEHIETKCLICESKATIRKVNENILTYNCITLVLVISIIIIFLVCLYNVYYYLHK